jgi:DivIVA domain-containing protein
VTSEDEHVYPYYRSPEDIRNEPFTHRMRGLDESEVRAYLDLLADQMAAVEWERSEMAAELERLRAREEQPSEHPQTTPSPAPGSAPGAVQPQAAAVLSHAQEVAEQLLDDASRRAQEIIAAAQRQGHEVVRRARIRTQDRMQSLYDELDGEFYRLGEATRPSAPDRVPPARSGHDT